MKCPDANHIHETGECPVCLALFEVVFLHPDEEVDCPECGFKVPVPKPVVRSVASKLRILQAIEGVAKALESFAR